MIICSLSGERLGEAKLLYVDSRWRDREETRLKTSARKLAQQTADRAISLRDRPDQSKIGETQHSEIFGTFLFLLFCSCCFVVSFFFFSFFCFFFFLFFLFFFSFFFI